MIQEESDRGQADVYRDLEVELRARRDEWEQRLGKIQGDRRRKTPLEPDFAEQATQRENDETLDALDTRGRQEIRAIEEALGRIADGSFGRCTRCSGEIPLARMQAYPEAAHCMGCADAGS